MSRRRDPLILLLALALTACTSGGSRDGGVEAEEPDAAATEASAGPVIDAPGVEGRITLMAPPEQGAGEIPVFEWEPVAGASAYRLAVLQGGDVLWAWEGEATSVALGGVADRPEGEYGPLLAGPGSWSVVAVDAQGGILAVSEVRPVAP